MRKFNMLKNVVAVAEVAQEVAEGKELAFEVSSLTATETGATVGLIIGSEVKKDITIHLDRVPKSTVTNFKVDGEDMAFPLTTMATIKAYTEQVINKLIG